MTNFALKTDFKDAIEITDALFGYVGSVLGTLRICIHFKLTFTSTLTTYSNRPFSSHIPFIYRAKVAIPEFLA